MPVRVFLFLGGNSPINILKRNKMKAGNKVKHVGESIYGLKGRIGKIYQRLPFEGLASTEKYWEVSFEGHIGTYLCLETDLETDFKKMEQLEFCFSDFIFLASPTLTK
jgi:hypothetical protein